MSNVSIVYTGYEEKEIITNSTHGRFVFEWGKPTPVPEELASKLTQLPYYTLEEKLDDLFPDPEPLTKKVAEEPETISVEVEEESPIEEVTQDPDEEIEGDCVSY